MGCTASQHGNPQIDTVPVKHARMKSQVGCCSAVLVLALVLLFYVYANYDILKLNSDGWVLYYSSTCPHCVELQKNLPPKIWKKMAKVDCLTGNCPPEVKSVPTWINKYTGQQWDGVGVFR